MKVFLNGDSSLDSEEQWPATWGVDDRPSPFQSRAWLRHWLKHRGVTLQPWFLVTDGGSTIAPFGRLRFMGIRLLQLLGTGDSDYTGLISTREPEEAWDSVVRELAQRRAEWDLLHLHSVPDRDAISRALQKHLGHNGFERIYEWCSAIRIDGTWDQFLATRRKLRQEVRRWTRRLEEQGPVTAEAVPPPVSNGLLDEIVELEQASWKWGHGSAAFKPGTQRDFLFALLKDPTTPVRVWTVRVGGKLAAAGLVLHDATDWFYYLSAYHENYKHAGSLLLARLVEGAHAANCRTFSFLRGDHSYKEDWANIREPVYEMVCPSTVRGQAAALVWRLRWAAANSHHLRSLRSIVFRTGDRR
ncbi:MAG: GNAT family N-acetyltransferase [Longimicrobiales bacterium]